MNITAASLDIVHSPAGTPRRPDKWPDPGDHLQLCSPDQKLNTFITNDPRCRDMGRPAPQPKCKTHSEMCLVIDNTPKLLVVSISAGILLPDLQTALLCSHLPTKCCKKSLGSGMRRDERETMSASANNAVAGII